VAVHGKACTLVRFHRCFICRRTVRHDYKALYQHLHLHKYDLEKYAKEFETSLIKASWPYRQLSR
jgi:hypothetical protein